MEQAEKNKKTTHLEHGTRISTEDHAIGAGNKKNK
jgi:hypothetical protein